MAQPVTIEEALRDINRMDIDGGIFLPYIQRDFVWGKDKIYALLDSLMRRYPIGTILTWRTEEAIDYRPFVKDYKDDYDFIGTMVEGNKDRSRRYVLDGQQRLQSLYIARYGSYDGGVLFFDLASNPDESRYSFAFQSAGYQSPGWVNVPDFLSMPFKGDVTPYDLRSAGLIPDSSPEEQARMETNAVRLFRTFKEYENIYIHDLSQEKGIALDDIAEVFVRINSEGVVLEKADLIMALLRGAWRRSGQELGQLINSILRRGFKNPKDFILRCCVAMLSKKVPGTGRTNGLAQLFAAQAVQDPLAENIARISEAINDVMSFIAGFSFLPPSKIPSYNPILILACYRYEHGRQAWQGIIRQGTAQSFLFSAFLSKALSGQSKQLMERLLAEVTRNSAFDLAGISGICDIRVDIKDLIGSDDGARHPGILIDDPLALLVMHLVYHGKQGYDPKYMSEKDHIFPRSEVQNYRVDGRGRRIYLKREYDSIVNCEMLSLDENLKKADKLPSTYFAELEAQNKTQEKKLDNFLKLHEIPIKEDGAINIWDIHFFREFLKARRALLAVRIEQSLSGLVTLTPKGNKKGNPKTTEKEGPQLKLPLKAD